MERGNIIGDEDVLQGREFYTTTTVCTSLTGLIGRMRIEDFLRLEN